MNARFIRGLDLLAHGETGAELDSFWTFGHLDITKCMAKKFGRPHTRTTLSVTLSP